MGAILDLFGGGSSSTEVTIPDWLQESLEPLLSGSAEKYGDWQQQLYDLAMGENADGTPRIFGDMSRGVAGEDWRETRAGELAGGLTEGSPLYGQANNLLNQLTGLNQYELNANRLAQVYADPRNSPYEHKQATKFLNQMATEAKSPVDFSGYESDPLFQQQMEAWETNVDPTITNAANSMGLGRFGVKAGAKGLSKTNAVRDALKGYITQGNVNKQTAIGGLQGAAAGMAGQSDAIRQARNQNLAYKQGLGRDLRAGRQAAATGKIGIADRSHQKKLDAINALSGLGATRRGINQDRLDSDWEEKMRLAAAFETAMGNPLGMIPGMTGATSTQQKKNK